MKIQRTLWTIAIAAGALGVIAKIRADDAKPTGAVPGIKTLPEARGGQDLVGKPMPKLAFKRWLNTPDNKPLDTEGSVTLYRWWTSSCPFCASTLPGIENLRKKYEANGLKVIAAYHPKPPREISDEALAGFAAKLGYAGPVALDQDWSQLKAAYLSTGHRGATSVSFLVDKKGVIRFVHPGVEYFPSDKPEEAQQNEDYRLMVGAIEVLLKE